MSGEGQNLDWVREFYCNIENIDDIGPSFRTWVRSKSISVSPELIRELLGIDCVFPEHYPFPIHPTCDFNAVAEVLCSAPRNWIKGALIKQFELLLSFDCLILLCVLISLSPVTLLKSIKNKGSFFSVLLVICLSI